MERETTAHRATTDELLARVPLFTGLSKKEIRQISAMATRIDVAAGRELTRQGETGKEFVVILDGEVEVLIDGEVVKKLGSGDFFGEIALLKERPRTATVVSTSPVSVDVIAKAEFIVLVSEQPEIAQQLLATMAESLAEDEARKG